MVIGILVFAAWLRLSNLDLIEFKRDEVNHLQLSADFLAHPRVLAVGSESSVGIDKPPFMVYLMTIPLVVSRDPRVATGFVALLNLGAVAGCYVLTRRYFGRTAALVAALLFGVSPWAVFFSRKIFTANLFPPFTVLFFLALVGAISLWQVYHITVAQATRNLSRDRAEASLVILGDDVRPGNSDLLSALTYLIGPDVKLRYLDADRLSLLFPAGSKETIFLVPPGDPPAAGLLAGRTRQLPESTVILPGGSAAFRFYQGSANQALTDQPGFPVRLGPGIRVLGYTIEPGEGCRERSLTSASSPLAHCILQLVITWQVLDTSAAPANPSFFNHLVDESGRKVSQHDGLDYPPRRWTNGDIFVSRYDLSLPANAAPGRYWILTGLYDYKTGVRQPAETEGGDALGDAVRLGPTMVPMPG